MNLCKIEVRYPSRHEFLYQISENFENDQWKKYFLF
jgi:hypothetical protein